MPDNPVIIRDGGAVSLWNMAFSTTRSSDMHWCQNFGHLGTGIPHAIGLEVKVYNLGFGDAAPYTEARWGNQVRFDKIAHGYGAHGEFVERREDIVPAIERALAAGRP